MRKKSKLSDLRKNSNRLLVRGSQFEDCLLSPGALKKLVIANKLPTYSNSNLAFAQQVTTLPRLQQWIQLNGGKPATKIIKSNLAVFEDETCSTIALAFKTNLMSPGEVRQFGKEAGELYEYGEFVVRSSAKQPLRDKHGRANGMKMCGNAMPMCYQRRGNPVICRYKPYRPGLGVEAAQRCMAITKDYVSCRHREECDMSNTAVIVWLKEGEGRMPPGGNFVLSDLCIELETCPGAGLLFDSTKVFHHNLDADSADPKLACRVACGLYVSKPLLAVHDAEAHLRKKRKMELEEEKIATNLKK